jgi:hypothetical protein
MVSGGAAGRTWRRKLARAAITVEDLFHSVKLANSWVLHACLVCMH